MVWLYVLLVFILPWAIALYWHIKLLFSISADNRVPTLYWAGKETQELIAGDVELSQLRKRRNKYFIVTLLCWAFGFTFLVLYNAVF